MDSLGFIVAMPQEIKPFLQRMRKWRRGRCGPFRSYRFEAFGSGCLLVECGVGQRRAAEATRELLAAVRPRLLVSFGVSGAMDAALKVGDVVSVEGGYLLTDGQLEQRRMFHRLSDEAFRAAAQALEPCAARLARGTSITTRGPQTVQTRPADLLHPILDMETAAIAQVAAEKDIPLLSLRSISDNPDQPLPFKIEDWYDDRDNLAAGKIIRTLLGQPGILPPLLRLNRNTNLAAQNLAVALTAALGNLGFSH